jgi:ABC-type nitrate/sulfonate/bicarbonate transport system permease component
MTASTDRGVEVGSPATAPTTPKPRRKPSPGLIRLAVVIVFLAAWQILAGTGVIDKLYVSTPIDVVRAMGDLASDPGTWVAFGQTGQELGLAFVYGTVAGFAVGVGLGLSGVLRRAYLGPLVFMLSVPKSVFVPIFVLIFGLGRTSATSFGAFSAFFYVVVTLVGGIGLVEDRHIQVARAYGAGPIARIRHVVLPGSLPGIYAALWQGVKHAFGGVLIAELWASQGGIGQLIVLYTSNLQSDHVLAITLVVALIAILLGSLWSRLERRMDWRREVNRPVGMQ